MSKSTKSFEDIESLSLYLKNSIFERDNIAIALYAFNATGKTRLAHTFHDSPSYDDTRPDSVKSIIYSAEFEDAFYWDNDTRTLHFGIESSWILKVIVDEGLENQIADRFKAYFSTSIEPVFDFGEGVVTFNLATGDDDHAERIKISRGEESILIWSVFLTLLENVADTLDQKSNDRATTVFDELENVIVDDPVSSIDDAKIVSVASDLADLTKRLARLQINVLITTHHALFYSVVVNSLRKKTSTFQFESYSLSQESNGELVLRAQGDAPFAYHLHAKTLLQKAIADNTVERYHFNIFRALLEKTANFLGYTDWTYCLDEEGRGAVVRLLHNYSHGRLSDMEPTAMAGTDVMAFSRAFEQFIAEYKWR